MLILSVPQRLPTSFPKSRDFQLQEQHDKFSKRQAQRRDGCFMAKDHRLKPHLADSCKVIQQRWPAETGVFGWRPMRHSLARFRNSFVMALRNIQGRWDVHGNTLRITGGKKLEMGAFEYHRSVRDNACHHILPQCVALYRRPPLWFASILRDLTNNS